MKDVTAPAEVLVIIIRLRGVISWFGWGRRKGGGREGKGEGLREEPDFVVENGHLYA